MSIFLKAVSHTVCLSAYVCSPDGLPCEPICELGLINVHFPRGGEPHQVVILEAVSRTICFQLSRDGLPRVPISELGVLKVYFPRGGVPHQLVVLKAVSRTSYSSNVHFPRGSEPHQVVVLKAASRTSYIEGGEPHHCCFERSWIIRRCAAPCCQRGHCEKRCLRWSTITLRGAVSTERNTRTPSCRLAHSRYLLLIKNIKKRRRVARVALSRGLPRG